MAVGAGVIEGGGVEGVGDGRNEGGGVGSEDGDGLGIGEGTGVGTGVGGAVGAPVGDGVRKEPVVYFVGYYVQFRSKEQKKRSKQLSWHYYVRTE